MRFLLILLLLGVCSSAVRSADSLQEPIEEVAVIESTQKEMPTEVSVEITADTVSYNDEHGFYEADGNAEAYLKEKDATLRADKITYDSVTNLLEATGDVSITQAESIIYGSYASFLTTTEKYIINDPRLFVEGMKLKARSAESIPRKKKKSDQEQKSDILFEDGLIALDKPISLYAHGNIASTKYSQEQVQHNRHRDVDWDDLTDKSRFHYTAKEIFYDKTKKTNNLRITGARVWINDRLSIPSPVQVTTTVGEAADTKFKGPVIGTRERVGGFAAGPRYYYSIDSGTFSLVPLLQMGNGPSFGGGALATFNTPGDKTAIMAGYGSLYNRFIANVHQQFWTNYEVNGLFNQFYRNSIFGASQVGQMYELASDHTIRLPFVDQRGLRLRGSVAFAKDNVELFSNQSRKIVAGEIDGNVNEDHSGFRSALEASVYSEPIWRLGHELANVSLSAKGQGAFRFYGTGDTLTVGRFGPALETRLRNLSFEIDYLTAIVSGESPFFFDQFIDGSQSILFDGDYKVNKWFSFGTLLTYNLSREQFVRNQVRTEFGPEDFKIRLSYDTIFNQIDMGFNAIFGDPVKYEKLKVRM